MLVIGLTGGIGSGKSTVAELFAKKGISIIDTDRIARDLTLPNQPALLEIVKRFGRSVLMPDGFLNRALLRKIIFENEKDRVWLEQLLHPLIRQEMEKQIAAATSPYCIAVIPLLVENLPNPLIQRILVVDAEPEDQLARSQARDQTTYPEIEAIIKAQADRKKRLALADDVISNTKNIEDLFPQVEKLHNSYLRLVGRAGK